MNLASNKLKKLCTYIFVLICIGLVFSTHSAISQVADFDIYGGTTALRFDDGEGNGFFRVKQDDDEKWWLVTPDNNAFLSIGINHFHSNYWWRDSVNRDFWIDEFGADKWQEEWKEGFYNHAQEVVADLKVNTLGYHNEDNILLERTPILPYIRLYRPLHISGHENANPEDYFDVFDDEFKEICDSVANIEVLPFINDKMLMGWAMNDIPKMTERNANARYSWAEVLRNYPASSPGKQEYVRTMQEVYASIADFNADHGSSFRDWDELTRATDWNFTTDLTNNDAVDKNNVFNEKAIHKYYQVVTASLKAIDPNHMFLGGKVNANIGWDELDLLVDVISQYVDIFLFQFFREPLEARSTEDRIAARAGIPIINGDGGFGFRNDPKMPNVQFPEAENHEERAEMFHDYAELAFSNPNYVGYHICGVIDSWNVSGSAQQNKPGIMDPFGDYHQAEVDTIAALSTKIYSFRGLDLGGSGNIGNTTYRLTVNSGSGSGNYEEGASVSIAAAAAADGYEFDAWTGDVANVVNVNSAATTITMPASNLTIEATYKESIANLLTNGDFATGDFTGWSLNSNGAVANADAASGEVVIDITSGGPESWKPQFVQGGFAIENGNTYRVKVDAKADENRAIALSVNGGDPTFTSIFFQEIDVTTVMQSFEYTFTATVTDSDCRFDFNLGMSTHNVTLDNISLEDITPPNNLVTNGDFSGVDLSPWEYYAFDSESNAEIVNGELVIEINSTPAAWQPFIEQPGLTMEANQEYTLSFDASAAATKPLNIRIFNPANTAIEFGPTFTLTTSPQTFTYSFTLTDDGAKLRFLFGATIDDVTIDNIVVMASGASTLNLHTWDGSENNEWSLAGNWDTNTVPGATDDVVIPNVSSGNVPHINDDITINDLTIASNGDLEIMDGTLQVDGDLTNNATLVVHNGSSLMLAGTRSGNGTEEFRRAIAGDFAYNTMSFPIAGHDPVTEGLFNFISEYDNSTSSYSAPSAGSTPAGKGLFVAAPSGTTYQVTGTMNYGNQSIAVSDNSGAGGDAFNLIGNPYGAAIDAATFFNTNSAVLTGTAWLWADGGANNGGGLRQGNYVVANSLGAASGTQTPSDLHGNSTPAKSTDDWNGSFNSFQGFFVEASTPGSVSFTPSMQITGDNTDDSFFRTVSSEVERGTLRLSLNGADLSDNILIVLDENSTLKEDYSMDGKKFPGNEFISFYAMQLDDHYAITALPRMFGEEMVVPLGFDLKEARQYTLTVDEFANFGEHEVVMLKDAITGKEYDLNETQEIQFSIFGEEVENTRFSVHFTNVENQVLLPQLEAGSIAIQGNLRQLAIKVNTVEDFSEEIGLFTITGQTIFQGVVDFKAGSAQLNNLKLQMENMYILKTSSFGATKFMFK